MDVVQAAGLPISWPAGPLGLAGDSTPDFEADRLGFLTRAAQQFGDFVPFRVGRDQMVLVSDPELIAEALVSPASRDFSKDYLTELIPPLIRRHLLLKDADSWLIERHLSQPAFHHDRLLDYARVIVQEAENMADGWPGGGRLELTASTRRLTLQILCRTLFDWDIAAQSARAAALVDIVLDEIDSRVSRRHLGAGLLTLPADLRLLWGLRQLERELERLIRERRRDGEGRVDLLSKLVLMRDEAGAPLSSGRIRYVMYPLFFAGHETTAMGLAWALYLLARNPEVESRALEELDRVLGDRQVTAADIPSLPYLGGVVNEALRLYPPIWGFGREAIRPTRLGPHPVPVGTVLWFSQWVMHRDPRWFDEPQRFSPERWGDGLGRRLPRCVYLPFGVGSRRCLGATFAVWEATLLLATVLRRFELRVAAGSRAVPEPSFTLRPRGGLWMDVRSRR
jgi:cytochrome P450